MTNYLCVKPLLNVRYTDYRACGDGCCDVAVDESYDFLQGEEYELDDEMTCRAGRCGRVYLEEAELSEHFVAQGESQ